MADLVYTLLDCPAPDNFTCGNSSIDEKIRSSHILTLLHRAYAYSVKAEGNTIGYYMLMLKRFPISRFNPPIDDHFVGNYEDLYAMHIDYIAVDQRCQGNRLGTAILRYILFQLCDSARNIPFRLITVDALEQRASWYEQFKFKPCVDRNIDNPETITMYYDLATLSEVENIEKYMDAS